MNKCLYASLFFETELAELFIKTTFVQLERILKWKSQTISQNVLTYFFQDSSNKILKYNIMQRWGYYYTRTRESTDMEKKG